MSEVRAAFASDFVDVPTRRLLLGSRSPRRAELLTRAGFVYSRRWIRRTWIRRTPTGRPDGGAATDGPALARGLAERKAASVDAADLPAGSVLLTADTLVVASGGGLLGTPESAGQAAATLRRLRGHTHVIATGVCLRGVPKAGGRSGGGANTKSFVATAHVHFGEIDDAEIDRYVAGGGWAGKAGGYNLEERQAAGWPVTVDGEAAAVMGLPLETLTPRLRPCRLISVPFGSESTE